MAQDPRVALVTGASSGFGRMIAGDLAAAGLTAYASMRGIDGSNAKTVEEIAGEARDKRIDLRTVELDVQSDSSVGAAVRQILQAHGRIDVVVHNAGHMGRRRPSRPSSWRRCTTSTCWARSG